MRRALAVTVVLASVGVACSSSPDSEFTAKLLLNISTMLCLRLLKTG